MYVDLDDKTLYAVSYEDAQKLEKFMEENNIEYKEIYSSYVNFCCPKCGDSEFWDGSHCDHCGYNL